MTDSSLEMDLDTHDNQLLSQQLNSWEKEGTALVTLVSSANDFEKVSKSLATLRASNISAILLMKKPDDLLEDEELAAIFGFLRDWDQLLLHNILELCEAWIPKAFLEPLRQEAKIEMKWFKEWLQASTDSKIHKYPGLPWRRFIRKIVSENYIFIMNFLNLVSLPATEENVKAVQTHFNQFLGEKKKVISLFPKRWNKPNEH